MVLRQKSKWNAPRQNGLGMRQTGLGLRQTWLGLRQIGLGLPQNAEGLRQLGSACAYIICTCVNFLLLFFFFFLCVCVCVCVCVSSIQCRVCQQNGLGLRQIGLGLRQKWTANNVDSSKQVRTETEPQKSRNLGQSEIVRNRLMGRAGSMMKNKKVRWRTKFHSIQSFKRLEKSD